jgi:hypothetical protein
MLTTQSKPGDSGLRRILLPGQWVRLTFESLRGAQGTVVAVRRPSRVIIRREHGTYVDVARQQVEAVNRRW